MTADRVFPKGKKFCAALLVGTVLGGYAVPAAAQAGQPAAQPAAAQPGAAAATPAPAAPQRTIRSLTVQGNQRLEVETVLSYTSLRAGEP